MKKKIAIFSTGWSEEMLDAYMKGVRAGLENESADVYFFVCFAALGDDEDNSKGELNIFNLPNMNDFDGALVLGNAIDYPQVLKNINDRCKEADIPVIFTGHRFENSYFVGVDNYYGARSLSEHLYNDHGIRDFFFVAGNKENMDSNQRLQALCDVISENGGTLTEDKIFYSNWNPRAAAMFIDEWVASGKKLPEAIVCANDEMAIIICDELRLRNVKVPEEVAVTGFDNLLFAQAYDPSISSVSQNFDKIGCESAKMLMDIINGTNCEMERKVLCEFVPGESCGCTECSNTIEVRRKIGRNRFIDNMFTSAFYHKLSMIDRCLMKCKTYEDIKVNYKDSNDAVFKNYEGTSYHLVLDPVFRDKLTDLDTSYRKSGYSQKMDVVFSLDDGNYTTISDFDTRKIVPQIANPDVNHLFICLPLQEMGNCLGYIIFADDYEKFKNAVLMGKYTERLSADLIRLQQTINTIVLNDRLFELSETDALTHVKNRTAYQARENKINEKIARKDCDDFALLLCDVNYLKKVNDKLGHEIGDSYLTNSCKLICRTFKRSAVYRIGGDEFVVFLKGDDLCDVKELIASMNSEMENIKEQDILDGAGVSIAVGLSYYCKETDNCLADVFKRADEAMYIRKNEMK